MSRRKKVLQDLKLQRSQIFRTSQMEGTLFHQVMGFLRTKLEIRRSKIDRPLKMPALLQKEIIFTKNFFEIILSTSS